MAPLEGWPAVVPMLMWMCGTDAGAQRALRSCPGSATCAVSRSSHPRTWHAPTTTCSRCRATTSCSSSRCRPCWTCSCVCRTAQVLLQHSSLPRPSRSWGRRGRLGWGCRSRRGRRCASVQRRQGPHAGQPCRAWEKCRTASTALGALRTSPRQS